MLPFTHGGRDVRTLLPQADMGVPLPTDPPFCPLPGPAAILARRLPAAPCPMGSDADSLAAQAILEFLLDHSLNLNPQAAPSSLDEILWEIKRLVLKHVTRLHHRKENRLLSNARGLAPVQIDDGEFFSPIEFIADPGPHTDAALLEKESFAKFDSSKSHFSSLPKTRAASGPTLPTPLRRRRQPQALASSLKVRRGTVQNLRKRLRRRWRRRNTS